MLALGHDKKIRMTSISGSKRLGTNDTLTVSIDPWRPEIEKMLNCQSKSEVNFNVLGPNIIEETQEKV